MNKLTDRLQYIANEINKGEKVCDIGTDHGYLPIYLYQQNIADKVILTDVSCESLKKAENNCKKACPEHTFDLRLGDGLDVVEVNEADTAVIAGMGGLLMTDILGADIEKSHSIDKFVLQPRNHVGELRHWLFNNGFCIVNEQLVREGKFICEILTVKNGQQEICSDMVDKPLDSIFWEVPKTLLDFKSELLSEYIQRKLEREKKILSQLYSAAYIDELKVSAAKKAIAYLKEFSELII